MPPKKLLYGFSFAAMLLAWHQPSLAHDGDSMMVGFTGGFVHPLAGPDHLLAMVAVGIWGAFLKRPLIYLLPMIFPTLMAVGGIAAMAKIPFPPIEIGIALSVILLGAAILGAVRASVWLAVSLVGLFGLFHGYAHGLELPSMADPIGFSLGFVLSTGLLHVVGIALGHLRASYWGEQILRSAGGLIALCGIWFLYKALI